LGVQKSFKLGDRSAIGFQAAVIGGESLDGIDCEGTGYEARAAAGTSFNVAGHDGFVTVEAGRKTRGPACEHSLAEVSAGLSLTPQWRLLGKAWGEQGDHAKSAKAEVTLYRDFRSFSLGLGYRTEISGAFEERGVIAVLWSRF
jgi:hypothetical protein